MKILRGAGSLSSSVFLVSFVCVFWLLLLLPTECFVRMHLTVFGRRRFFSSAAAAVVKQTSRTSVTGVVLKSTSSTSIGSVNNNNNNSKKTYSTFGFTAAVASAAPNTPSYESYTRRHARLFGTTFPMMESIEQENNTKKKKYTDYERWVRRLYMTNLFHPVKLGLDNMNQLHELMGKPMDDPNRLVVHIAGTNGKGSVALKIANTLQQCGLTVGLFCSPHVSSFRERMQVNGDMISEEEVVELLPKVYEMCIEHDIPATFFEITTALAFLFYAKRQTQVVVLETGLGGRLDATNVIAQPAISIITSIGLEHTRILGDTIEAIAKEKGGIIKPGRPVLVGPHCPQDVLQQCAREKGAGPYYVPQQVLNDAKDMSITDYDEENQRISKAALRLLKQQYPDLLQHLTDEIADESVLIRPPCRFEHVVKENEDGTTTTVILDVAHNPPAMEYLVSKLKNTYPDRSFRFVVGMSSDKDLGQCGRSLLQIVNSDPTAIHLVEAAHPRAAKLEAILDAEPTMKNCNYNLEDRSITRQIHQALDLIIQQKQQQQDDDEILVVCGSVFVMAEAREALGIVEPKDSDYIAEMAGAGVRHGQENFGNTTVPMDDDGDDDDNSEKK